MHAQRLSHLSRFRRAACIGAMTLLWMCSSNRSVSDQENPDPQGGRAEGVQGVVTSAIGQPLEGALVEARSLGDHGPAVPDLAVITDRGGRYRWPLSPGRYKIFIRRGGVRVFEAEIKVAAGQVTRLDVILKSAE